MARSSWEEFRSNAVSGLTLLLLCFVCGAGGMFLGIASQHTSGFASGLLFAIAMLLALAGLILLIVGFLTLVG